jgi:hypothetical protein
VAIVPATNDPIALVASAGPARPAFAILFPSSAVAIEADSPGVLSQDRRRRAAEHRAVVDAGEHDQRTGRIELRPSAKQHGHGKRRDRRRKHADERAERHCR